MPESTIIVVLTDRSGIVSAILRFGRGGTEYTGARGGDMHLRARLVELFHHRKRAVEQSDDRPFSGSWLRSHFRWHLNAIDPDLVAHLPLEDDHPDIELLVVGRRLPASLARRFAPHVAPHWMVAADGEP